LTTYLTLAALVAVGVAGCGAPVDRETIPPAPPTAGDAVEGAPPAAGVAEDRLVVEPLDDPDEGGGPGDPADLNVPGTAAAEVPGAAADAPGAAPMPGAADSRPAGGEPGGSADAGRPLAGDPASGSDPAAAPGEARFTRLTEPGCCSQAFWSADGLRVQFLDKPASDKPVGIWAVDVAGPGTPPELVTEDIGFYSADMAFRVETEGETTAIVRRADGQRWTVPAGGRAVSISPGGRRIAWQVSPQGLPPERRTTRIWVANLDGTDAREVGTLPRGSLAGWLGDDRLLVRGRDRLDSDEDVLMALAIAGGGLTEIVRTERLGGVVQSPGGKWVAYYVSRLPDPADTGLWIAPTDGGAPRRLDKSLFGAYRWRDADRLLVVPLRADSVSHELIEVDAASLATRRLTDPRTTPFKIANGDWTASPDGRRVAYVERRDRSIWVIELP